MNNCILYAAIFCNFIAVVVFLFITIDLYKRRNLPSQPEMLKTGINEIFKQA